MYWPTNLSRRTLLASCTALVGGSLAGCTLMAGQGSDGGDGRGAASIMIHNEMDEKHTVSITATDSDGKTWIDLTDTVAAHTAIR